MATDRSYIKGGFHYSGLTRDELAARMAPALARIKARGNYSKEQLVDILATEYGFWVDATLELCRSVVESNRADSGNNLDDLTDFIGEGCECEQSDCPMCSTR